MIDAEIINSSEHRARGPSFDTRAKPRATQDEAGFLAPQTFHLILSSAQRVSKDGPQARRTPQTFSQAERVRAQRAGEAVINRSEHRARGPSFDTRAKPRATQDEAGFSAPQTFRLILSSAQRVSKDAPQAKCTPQILSQGTRVRAQWAGEAVINSSEYRARGRSFDTRATPRATQDEAGFSAPQTFHLILSSAQRVSKDAPQARRTPQTFSQA
ncbi:MAG: hypothetical protein AB7P50_13480, partial [Alphaproteobacteria bacterium]